MSRRIVFRAGQAALSFGLLAYLAMTVPMREVAESLFGSRVVWLVYGLAAVVAAQIIGALQMRSILASQGASFSVWQVAGINVIASFYNLFLPGSLAGGVVRWHHFSTPDGKHPQALAAILFSRSVEIATMLAYGIVFWCLSNVSGSVGTATTLAVSLAGVVSVVLLIVSPAQHAILRAVLAHLKFAHPLRHGFLEVSSSLVEIGRRGPRHQLRFVALCILRNALAVTAFLCFAHAVRLDAAAIELGWVRSATDLLLVLPISIAGVGVRDATLVALLTPLGVPSSTALAFSFLLLGVTLLIALTGGVVEGLRVYYGIAPGLTRPVIDVPSGRLPSIDGN